AVLEDNEQRLWVATSDGLDLFAPDSATFVRYERDADNPQSLRDSDIMSLYQDRGGVLWVGTRQSLEPAQLAARPLPQRCLSQYPGARLRGRRCGYGLGGNHRRGLGGNRHPQSQRAALRHGSGQPRASE